MVDGPGLWVGSTHASHVAIVYIASQQARMVLVPLTTLAAKMRLLAIGTLTSFFAIASASSGCEGTTEGTQKIPQNGRGVEEGPNHGGLPELNCVRRPRPCFVQNKRLTYHSANF